MKRSRCKSGLCSGKEEEEAEYNPRNGLKERKQINYTENFDETEKQLNKNEQEDKEDQEKNELPGPSDQKTSTRIIQPMRLLSVTCGNKKGIMDTDKLRRGVDCIECEGRWFSPSDFEIFGGKGACKKWKSTVLHKKKPLKVLFEKGLLTTKGYQRRSTKTLKPKKNFKTNSFSEDSDKQCAEEIGKNNSKDDVQSPGSEKLKLKTKEQEEEIEEPENGEELHVVDFGHDINNDEEDETEHGEMEDNEMSPAANENDNNHHINVCKDLTKKEFIISPSIKRAFQEKMEALFERLSESGLQSNCMELIDSWSKSLDETQTESMRKHSGSEMDDLPIMTAQDESQMPDVPLFVGDFGRNEEEFMQSHKEKDRLLKRVKAETENSPRCLSATATSSPHITPKETGSINNSTSQLVITEIKSGFMNNFIDDEDKEDGELEKGFYERNAKIQKKNQHLYESACEEGQPLANANVNGVSARTVHVNKGTIKPDLSCQHGNLLPTDATSCHDRALLNVIKLEMGVSQMTQASNSTHFPYMVERAPSVAVVRPNLETMDLDHMKREKIKMQLKVLQLQEECYTLILNDLKNSNSQT